MKGGLYKAVTEDELQVTDSALNEGTLSQVTSESGGKE